MKSLLRRLIRVVLESEAATLAHDCAEWRERAIAAEAQLALIAGLRAGSRVEKTETGFAAYAVSPLGTRHKGAGLTAAEAIRASGTI